MINFTPFITMFTMINSANQRNDKEKGNNQYGYDGNDSQNDKEFTAFEKIFLSAFCLVVIFGIISFILAIIFAIL